MVAPSRQHLWSTPQKKGLRFENVQFPAQDGLRVSGWFIPASEETSRAGRPFCLFMVGTGTGLDLKEEVFSQM